MPKICYREKRFGAERKALIEAANKIILEYQSQGYELTLRQLYYQFVSRDLIPNTQKDYKNLGDVINDARLAGLIDWLAIVDRTRNLRSVGHWDSPEEIIKACARQFALDKWENQPCFPEVWVEKDALVGVVGQVCTELDVPYFSCRGYTSQSEMWIAAQRMKGASRQGRKPIVFHLGDHDPSGKDMSRDIQDRLKEFSGVDVEFRRLALNMDQVEQYNPPPNPAKITDSRANGYIEEFGESSWELDALEPKVIDDLIRDAVMGVRQERLWNASVEEENKCKDQIRAVSDKWTEIVENL